MSEVRAAVHSGYSRVVDYLFDPSFFGVAAIVTLAIPGFATLCERARRDIKVFAP